MQHSLKIWPQYYARVKDGTKTFEIRENDRGFQRGDIVELLEWDPEPVNKTTSTPKGFTDAEPLYFEIGYIHVLSGSSCVFSLLPLKDKEKPKKPKKIDKP